MIVIRIIAVVFLVVALMLLGADVVSTLEMQGVVFVRSLAQVLLLLGVDAVTLFQTYTPMSVATYAALVLGWPGWATLGILGVILAAIAYQRVPD